MTSRTERRDSEHDDRAECSTPPPSEKNGGERPRGGGVFVEKRTPPIQVLESKRGGGVEVEFFLSIAFLFPMQCVLRTPNIFNSH